MAVEVRKATAISNRDATPAVLTDAIIGGSRMIEAVGTVETGASDSVNSTYILASIPSNARIAQVLVYSDDIGTTTAADFGFYETTENGGAVVDADAIASAVSLNGGALNGSDITFESGVYDVSDIEKPLWEVLGKSEDTNRFYDFVATLTGAADAAATLSVVIRYTQ